MTVEPGDRLSAHVAVSGETVTVSISDLTRQTTFSKQLQMNSPTVSSAEWIAEAPSRCLSSSSQDCHILSQADFGSVTFTVTWQRPEIQMPAPPVIVSGPIYN